jgi:hypothetical protein
MPEAGSQPLYRQHDALEMLRMGKVAGSIPDEAIF